MFPLRSQCFSRSATTQRQFCLNRSICVLFLLLLNNLSNRVEAFADRSEEVDPMKYCGMALNDILDNICIHGYPHRLRRSSVPEEKLRFFNLDQILGSLDPELVFQRTLKRTTKGIRRRRLASIINECCRHGCVYGDIAAYCTRT